MSLRIEQPVNMYNVYNNIKKCKVCGASMPTMNSMWCKRCLEMGKKTPLKSSHFDVRV